MLYDLEDEDWNDHLFEHVQVLQEMKNSVPTSARQEKTPLILTSNSSQLEEEVQDY